ncbi:MAG TPA: carbohydrate kinase family protein [Polyangiaceae bacterium]
MATTARLVGARARASFDVICAGEPIWKTLTLRGERLAPCEPSAPLLEVARALARNELRVGLATVFDDDRFGRALLDEMAAMGMDVDGVTLALPASDLVVVDATGGQLGVVSDRDTARDFEVPAGWSSRVLLLSGLSPVTSKAAALCKAARRARREGTVVVLDVTGSLRQWAGADPRILSMVVREADVVRCSLLDLAVLGTDAASVRRAMRRGATLALSEGAVDEGGQRTAALCAELARPRR